MLRLQQGNQSPRAAWLFALAAALAVALHPCAAQSPVGEIVYTRQTVFRIPFEIEPGKPRPRQIQLYVSTDQGRNWVPSGTATADQRGFEFRSNRDGLYWFAVRTIQADGRAEPATIDGMQPQLRVYVDTGPQVVFLRTAPARDGQVGVEWEVRDDSLDLRTLRLDYRPPGGNWLPVNVSTVATGIQYFNSPGSGLLEVRLAINDRSGNPREVTTTLNPTVGGSGQDIRAFNEPAAPRAPVPGNARVVLVNSKKFILNYEVREKGPSGVSVIELWATQDGRNWKLHDQDNSPNPQPPFNVEVVGEGLFGFTLVVRSGVGLGDKPPQVGDPPQVWVEVDLTKPVVTLEGVDVGRGVNNGNLTVAWRATDKNLRQQPITLSYAERADGPWTQIAANLDNTGRHVWRMPKEVPYKFLVRVEAADRAGNIGSHETPQHVIVDLSQPKGHILGVEPAGK